MTRRELTRSIATYLNHQGEKTTEKAVDSVLVAALEVIEDAARQCNSVELRGFGRFYGTRAAARTYVNPRKLTERVSIPEHLQLRFTASTALRKRINQP